MANAIIPFSPIGKDVPAHLSALFEDSNMPVRQNIDQLSYRGKVWRRIVDGEETTLTRRNEDGDMEPVSVVSLVVLDINKARSRAYYPGAFEEGKNTAPTCFSGDGVKPDVSVKEPCAATCASCPNSVKGSKITEAGKQSTACAPFKRIAVVPSSSIGKHVPLLLRLAQTSVWDKDNGENEAKGWYAWDQYMDMLRARGVNHTAAVETKVKFDMRMAYPKLLFSASRWLNPDEAVAAKNMLTDSRASLDDILTGTQDRDGATGQPAPASLQPPKTKPIKVQPSGPDIDAEEDDENGKRMFAEALAAEVAKKDAEAKAKADKDAKKAARAAAAEKAKKDAEEAARLAAQDDDDDSGDGFVVADEATKPSVSAKATPAKLPPETTIPSALSDLLADWDA